MGQVPEYAVIGDGRMARHFCHYLDLLNISYQQWSRKADPSENQLPAIIDRCNPILILITDGAIEAFIQARPLLHNKSLIHFSGSLHTELACNTHPLMTFSHEFYPLSVYQKIPFAIETKKVLSELLPGLPNPSFVIPPELKSYYHALCVISGNFAALLWQKFFNELENRFQVSKEIAFPYLEQICLNLQKDSLSALTGPLVRNDEVTIKANLQALEHDSFKEVYQAFVEVYQESCFKKSKEER